jgi:hypothetical protein
LGLEEWLGRQDALDHCLFPTDEVTMKEMGRNQQLRTGEVLIIVVVLFMWAGESGFQALLHLPLGNQKS